MLTNLVQIIQDALKSLSPVNWDGRGVLLIQAGPVGRYHKVPLGAGVIRQCRLYNSEMSVKAYSATFPGVMR